MDANPHEGVSADFVDAKILSFPPLREGSFLPVFYPLYTSVKTMPHFR